MERGWAVKLGGKTTGEEKVIEIMRPMICNNHPVSADRGFNMVLYVREGWLARWLEESTTEESLESF